MIVSDRAKRLIDNILIQPHVSRLDDKGKDYNVKAYRVNDIIRIDIEPKGGNHGQP